MNTISRFAGQYRFLSNFFLCEVEYGWIYPSVEHAFQAAKTLDLEARQPFWRPERPMTPAEAKRAGRQLKLRADWEDVKLGIMEELIRIKFGCKDVHNPDPTKLVLRELLLKTGNAELIEGNNWGDRFWGVDGSGDNHLGEILMKIRAFMQCAEIANGYKVKT